MYENGWNKLSHYVLASESDLYNVSKYNEVAKLFTMRCCKQMSYNTTHSLQNGLCVRWVVTMNKDDEDFLFLTWLDNYVWIMF